MKLHELRAALGSQGQVAHGEARLKVGVLILVLEQGHERTEDADLLAGAVVVLRGRNVVEGEGGNTAGLEVLRGSEGQDRGDSTGVEELLVICREDGHVSDGEGSVALTNLVVTTSKGDHLLDRASADQVGLAVALAREEGENTRNLVPDLRLLGLSEVEQGSEAARLEHSALGPALNHLSNVGHGGYGMDFALRVIGLGQLNEGGKDSGTRHGDLVLLGQGHVAKGRRSLALTLNGIGGGGKDEGLEGALADALHAQ